MTDLLDRRIIREGIMGMTVANTLMIGASFGLDGLVRFVSVTAIVVCIWSLMGKLGAAVIVRASQRIGTER